ncbi:MAG: ATP-binding protein, partial [Bacteroidales bacterium]|nr:ATP-binding protein [Bacteroidales bacterium]
DIPVRLDALPRVNGHTRATYIGYCSTIMCTMPLLRMAVDLGSRGTAMNVFSRWGLTVFALSAAMFFEFTSLAFGFNREKEYMEEISGQLAIDRDFSLETILLNSEKRLTADEKIGELAQVSHGDRVILNRLSENYFVGVPKSYDVAVAVCLNNDAGCFSRYRQRIARGTPIADGSNFSYTFDAYGRARYLGRFVYNSEDNDYSTVLIDISDKSYREDRGYYSILGRRSGNGAVDLPPSYSYAFYKSGRLTRYKGDSPYYSNINNDYLESLPFGQSIRRSGEYLHFINKVGIGECIFVSRKRFGVLVHLVTFLYLFLVNVILMLPLFWGRFRLSRAMAFRSNYFRTRINAVMYISLGLALAVMAVLCVTFIFRRNVSNRQSVMEDQIASVQTALENQYSESGSLYVVDNSDVMQTLDRIGAELKTDITLFLPNGKVLASTMPDIFDRFEIGSRMDGDAYCSIRYRNQRLFVNAERIRGRRYFALYAPVLNARGNMIAMVCVPYLEQNIDFRNEALFYGASFVYLFLILIVATMLISRAVVNNMFRPLEEMGRKMNTADVQGLSYIVYKRRDEVSTLVDAYNRMVHDLSESMKQATQAERDKAWSEMARQVAHEIKNPLTPIKLELQRLIRLKERNDPSWDEKFAKISVVILDHIDILTNTANEFSTFAKLYTEEPVLFDVDAVLKDQMAIFDNKENITMSYIGLPEAFVLAPRPQLIRVFVNLITNAVQAIEISQAEARENGGEVVQGQILVSLRNSVRDGFYDIVVEDNGPGVKEENRGRLFAPNFTTKSGGTGLGLAICRNIIEKCGGTISYQKSFAFAGASFVVSLPKGS